MLQDAAKRLAYTAKQAKDPGDLDLLVVVVRALLRATERADLEARLNGNASLLSEGYVDPAWLAELIRPMGHTPFDPLIPWAFTQLRKFARDISSTRRGVREVLWAAGPDIDAYSTVRGLTDAFLRSSPDLLAWYLAAKPDLTKLDLRDALNATVAWRDTQAAKVVYAYPDGWTMRRLTTNRELAVEGDRMEHCVGGWEYCNKVYTGTSIIYSLRDPADEPYATLEWLVKEAWFKQIYGPGDQPITDDVRPYVLEFITRVHGGAPRDMIMAGVPPRDVLQSGGRYHQIDLSQADLAGAYLAGIDLTGAGLFEADLVGADLTDAILIGANLFGADLTDATLIRANLFDAGLTRAFLIDADLRGADLRKATLIGADMRGADLRGAKLRGANLTDAKLGDATMPDGSQFDAQARRHRA
jgi:hypothetical protein